MIKGACVNRAYSYGKDGPITHYFIRTEKAKHHIKSYIDVPYIFAKVRGKPNHQDILHVSKPIHISQCGEKLCKIIVKEPRSVSGYIHWDRKLRMRIDVPAVRSLPNFSKVFEDIIEFPDRCAVDNGIKYGMWASSNHITDRGMIGGMETDILPHIVTLDIEVRTYLYDTEERVELDSSEFPDVTEATNEILSIQCLDNQTEEIHFFKLHTDYEDHFNDKTPMPMEYNLTEVSFKLEESIKKLVNSRDKFVVHEYIFRDDRSMLEEFVDFIVRNDYDIPAAFYGKNFDYPYLFARMRLLKINYHKLSPLGYVTVRIRGTRVKGKYIEETDIRIPGRNLMDTRELLMDKIYEKRAKNGLTDFSEDDLGKGKIKHDPIIGRLGKFHSIDYEFFEQPEKFKYYACYDVILDFYLQRFHGIWKHYITLVKSSGCQIFHVTQSRKRVRQRSLFYAKKLGFVIEPDSFGSGYTGAAVIPPEFVGKIEMAADLDLTSQYPSIIQAFNISWDTLVLDHSIMEWDKKLFPEYAHIIDIQEIKKQGIPYCRVPIKGIYFRLDKVGLFPLMIADTRGLRDRVRSKLKLLSEAEEAMKLNKKPAENQMNILWDIGYNKLKSYEDNKDLIQFVRGTYDNDQKVLKVDINSIFGNLPPLLGACVTAVGRILIKYTRHIITRHNYPPIYTDTDSVIFKTMRKTGKGALLLADWLANKINIGYKRFERKYNCRKGFIDIKSEEIYNPIIFVYNKSSKKGEAAAKKYVKCLIVDRGVVLSEPKLDHKGILKKRQSSAFAVDMGYLFIYYIGMNYPNHIVIDRANKLITKAKFGFSQSHIPQNELDDMKKKKISIRKGHYTLEEIAFPVNIRKHFRDYKVLNYIQKGIITTNKYSRLWSSVHRSLGKDDTAFVLFTHAHIVDEDSPSDLDKLPKNTVWALNDDGELHVDFKINFGRHIARIISKYDVLLKAVGINPKVFLEEKNQTRISFK